MCTTATGRPRAIELRSIIFLSLLEEQHTLTDPAYLVPHSGSHDLKIRIYSIHLKGQ